MTAGQIIASSTPQCQSNSRGKGEFKKKQIRQKLNLDSLDETATQQQLQASLRESLQQEYPDDIEGHWSLLKSNILDTCKTILGYKSRKHQDWFDENDTEIEQLISKKRKAFCAWQNDVTCKAKRLAHSRAKADVQRRVRELKKTLGGQKGFLKSRDWQTPVIPGAFSVLPRLSMAQAIVANTCAQRTVRNC